MKRKILPQFEGWHTFVTCMAMLVALQVLNFSITCLLQAPLKSAGLLAAVWLLTLLSIAGLVYLVRELVRQLRLLRHRSHR